MSWKHLLVTVAIVLVTIAVVVRVGALASIVGLPAKAA